MSLIHRYNNILDHIQNSIYTKSCIYFHILLLNHTKAKYTDRNPSQLLHHIYQISQYLKEKTAYRVQLWIYYHTKAKCTNGIPNNKWQAKFYICTYQISLKAKTAYRVQLWMYHHTKAECTDRNSSELLNTLYILIWIILLCIVRTEIIWKGLIRKTKDN